MPDSKDVLEQYRAQADEMIAVAAKTPRPIAYINLSRAKGSGRLRYWSSRLPGGMDNIAGEHPRAEYGTGENTRCKLFDSEMPAHRSATTAHPETLISRVAVEENKSGEWVLPEAHSHRA